MAKFCTEATNLLKLLSQSSANWVAVGVGVFGVDCAAGDVRMYTSSVEGATGSGLLVAWAVAVGFNFMGIGLRVSFCGSFAASIPMPSSVIKALICSFVRGKKVTPMFEDSDNPSTTSTKSSIISSCTCYSKCFSTMVSLRHSSSGLSSP